MNIFSILPVRTQDITVHFVRTQMQIYQKDLFTGIFHINGKSQLVFLFVRGKFISIYWFDGVGWVNISKSGWENEIEEGAGELRIAGMAADGARVLRLFLESDFTDVIVALDFPSNELISYLTASQRGENARLVSMFQNGVSAIMLFPNAETVPTEAALMTDSQVQTGLTVLNQVRAWGNRPCTMMLCADKPNSIAWQEYSLWMFFSRFVHIVIGRYGELAGQFLVNDLSEHINSVIRDGGLALSLYGNKLSSRHFFEDINHASQAYVTIFSAMNKEMMAVVGDKMAVNIRKEAIMQLDLDSRILVQEYVISRLG